MVIEGNPITCHPDIGAIIRPARNEDVNGYVDILAKAFPDKFRIIFGDRVEAGVSSLVDHYGPLQESPGHYVVEVGAEMAGVLHLTTRETCERGLRGFFFFLLRLGLICGTRALISFAIMNRRVDAGDSYISHIAVHPCFRGHGVGKMLMDAAERRSIDLGKERLTLYVASDNASAKGLYLSRGFRTVKVDESEIAERLLGKGRWEYMVKEL